MRKLRLVQKSEPVKKRVSDSWCEGQVLSKNGNLVSGGAKRNVLIADAGGMDEIIADAVQHALERASGRVQERSRRMLQRAK